MALINRDLSLQKAVTLMSRLSPPKGVELLSYKRNRGVSLLALERDRILVRERGYLDQELTIKLEDLQKTLKIIIKREFPRSRKVRFYHLSGPEEWGQARKKL